MGVGGWLLFLDPPSAPLPEGEGTGVKAGEGESALMLPR